MAYLQDKAQSIPNAYYYGMDDAIDTAYNKGLIDGKTGNEETSVDVVYTAYHTHGDFCYPIPETKTWSSSGPRDDLAAYVVENRAYIQCLVCNQTFRGAVNDGDYRYPSDYHWQQARNKFNAHLVAGRCKNGGYQCGKEAGEYDTTDVTVLGAGDKVVSAIIKYKDDEQP